MRLSLGAALVALSLAACGGGSDTGGNTKDGGTGNDGGTGGTGGCAQDSDCSGGRSCCDGACLDLQTDLDHCGACDNACGEPAASSVACVDGACSLTCSAGYGDCDVLAENGCEKGVEADPKNCGGCGNVCLFANAEPDCESSKCVILACKAGFADCNNDPSDGCEADLSNDPLNCKECGTACAPISNAQPYCLAGECGPGPCLTGFGDCNDDPSDGCEVDLTADAVHCGACTTVCPTAPHATTTCVASICKVGSCDPGRADCDGSVWSGCETDLSLDVYHCNACGNACPAVSHGYPACLQGTCGVGGCDAGYADCDGDPSNGCEVNLASDALNCGVCSNACAPVANGDPVCSGFSCGIGACTAPFADCFGGSFDGCETNLQTSVDHCGACPTICPAVAHGSRACSGGTCGIGACADGFGDCNGAVSDGCEITFAGDLMNCGSCGHVCPTPAHGVAGCVSGTCTLASCDVGYSDCDGDAGNGCEFNTLVDPNNCGGCGLKCGSGVCSGATCQCLKTVLLIADDSPTGTTVLKNALTAAGYTVTQTSVPAYQYNGTNPATTGFGAVVVLAGGPGSTSYLTDMPAAGQTAILNFVNAGNGLVLTEWAAYQVAGGRWQTLKPLVLLTRSQAYTGQVTYTVDSAFAAHPLWAGLPGSFTIASTSNVGITSVAAGVTRVAGSAQVIDAVALRDTPSGRVVHLAHAGNYAPNGWTNTNMQKLVANAVGWVARCP